MTKSTEFTPFDLFRLAKEAAEHEVEMKIKLAKAGLGTGSDPNTKAK